MIGMIDSMPSPNFFCRVGACYPQFGGTPLYQACKLDLPETARALLEHGASVVQVYNDETPLQVALSQRGSNCLKVRLVCCYCSKWPMASLEVFVAPPPCIRAGCLGGRGTVRRVAWLIDVAVARKKRLWVSDGSISG